MTLEELKAAIQEMGFNDNTKVVIVAGKNDDGTYQFARLDILDVLLLYNENIAFLYPEDTNVFIPLMAGGAPNTFGAWAEIVASDATTLSSKFTSKTGYLSELLVKNASATNKMYVIEIAYGDDKVVVSRMMWYSDWTYILNVRSARIPMGEVVYYRLKSETALATVRATFRYYYL